MYFISACVGVYVVLTSQEHKSTEWQVWWAVIETEVNSSSRALDGYAGPCMLCSGHDPKPLFIACAGRVRAWLQYLSACHHASDHLRARLCDSFCVAFRVPVYRVGTFHFACELCIFTNVYCCTTWTIYYFCKVRHRHRNWVKPVGKGVK